MPKKPFLHARWEHLAMLNYEIDPDIIRPLVPAGTELDFFAGRTYVSLVGFMFLDTKVKGLGIPFHRDFEEVNLRFYVRRQLDGETRRGVVFVKELVPRAAIAWVARTVYGESYLALPMRHQISKQSVEYSWRFENRWNSLSLNFDGLPRLPAAGSEEQFITEHYWGYATQRDGTTVEYQVTHPAWKVWRASSSETEISAAALYGDQFAETLASKLSSAFLAEGSAVTVHAGQRL